MALFYLKYTFLFPETDKNSNPRICKLAVKTTDEGEWKEALVDDDDIRGVSFSESSYRFVVYVGSSPVFDSIKLIQDNQLNKNAITATPEITSFNLPNGDSTTTIKVNLSSGYETSLVKIDIISKKPLVPMMNYEDIPNAPELDNINQFSPRVTPASAFRLEQIIDQADIQRQLGIAFAGGLIPNFSSAIGLGYGSWTIYNKKTEKINNYSFDNFEPLVRYLWEARSQSLSFDVGAGGAPFTIAGISGSAVVGAAGGGTTASAIGSINVQVINTIEAQKIRYDYTNKTPYDLGKKLIQSLKPYNDIYQKTAADADKILINDSDNDGVPTIIDRLYELSATTNVISFKNIVSPIDFNKNPESEYNTLLEKYSLINKSIVLKNLTKLSSISNISYKNKSINIDSKMKAYKVPINKGENEDALEKEVSIYLLIEDGSDSVDISSDSTYTVYCKCLFPQWIRQFDYFTYSNLDRILGVNYQTRNLITQLFYDKNSVSLDKLSEYVILLIVRSKNQIENSNSTGTNSINKISTRNTAHNDSIIAQNTETTTVEDSFRANSFIANVPLAKDTAIDNVGYVQGNTYYEIIPGFSLQVRAGHGMFYVPDQEVSLAQPRIFGQIVSPHMVLNPYNVSDILNGGNSILNDGSILEIFSNMGRDRSVAGADIPFFSPNQNNGGLGGNLDFFVYSVTETADIFTPSLISYKSNLNSQEEYVTFKDSISNNVINYSIKAGNTRFASPVNGFSSTNATFTNVRNGTVYSDCTDDAVHLDSLYVADVESISINDDNEVDFGTINNLGISTISQLYFKLKQTFVKGYPYVLMYETSNSELSSLANNGDTFVPFGATDNNGKIIPKIFNLSNGANYLICKDLVEATSIKLVPAKGIDNNLDFSKIGEISEGKIYGPQENLSKNPIAHIRLERGDQFIIMEAKEANDSGPTAIIAAEINAHNANLTYPGNYGGIIDIDDNARLNDFVNNDFIASKTANENQYYLLGYMDESTAISDPKAFLYLIGFLYDSSGSPTNQLACIPIPELNLSSGTSTINNHEIFDQFLITDVKDKKEPDGGRFPFFTVENSSNFIIDPNYPVKQKPGICKIGKSTLKLIFLANEDGGIDAYFNKNIGRNWTKLNNEFTSQILNVIEQTKSSDGTKKNKVIENNKFINVRRIACSRQTTEDTVYLFIYCNIEGQQYFVLSKRIPFKVLDYFTTFTEDRDPNLKEEMLNLLRQEPPVLAIGNPNSILPSDNIRIRVGNSQKNNENSYVPLNLLASDFDTINQSTPEENLKSIQNIDISQDLKTGTFKIYYINNKGHRDCKASRTGTFSWQSFNSF